MVQKTEDNKTALIIIDIQNDYFPRNNGISIAQMIRAAKAASVLSYFRKKKCLLSTCNTRTSRRSYLPNTEGAEIHKYDALKQKSNTKNFPNSFNTELLVT
jgi:nicotinamidase-related amidase